MINGQFVYALTAGMVVTLNPCGFAMLPAYLGSFLGLTGPVAERPSPAANLRRAILVSLAVSLGFTAVFLVIGSIIKAGATQIYDVAQWLTIVIGVVLVVLGIAVVAGYRLPILTPKIEKGGQGRSFWSMFIFGMSYAVASLGCSLPVFLAVLFGSTTRDGIASGVVSFLIYSLGFALILTGLTVSLALAQGGLLKFLRKAMQWVDRLSGVFLIIAGLYLTWYGISEVRKSTNNGVVSKGLDWSGQVTTWIQSTGAVSVALVLGAIAVFGGAMAWLRRD